MSWVNSSSRPGFCIILGMMPLSVQPRRISNNDEETAMIYFVTGATGFIGKRLVAKLLEKPAATVLLPHPRQKSGAPGGALRLLGGRRSRAIPIVGDLLQPRLGVAKTDLKKLKGKVDHFFHLAAIYDLKASAEAADGANVDGTRNAVDLAGQLEAGCFHQVSSIAAAGLFEGLFREDMFDEAENLDHPYFRTKHDSEKHRAQGVQAIPGASTARASSSAIRAPAKWTRSTARTTSSS